MIVQALSTFSNPCFRVKNDFNYGHWYATNLHIFLWVGYFFKVLFPVPFPPLWPDGFSSRNFEPENTYKNQKFLVNHVKNSSDQPPTSYSFGGFFLASIVWGTDQWMRVSWFWGKCFKKDFFKALSNIEACKPEREVTSWRVWRWCGAAAGYAGVPLSWTVKAVQSHTYTITLPPQHFLLPPQLTSAENETLKLWELFFFLLTSWILHSYKWVVLLESNLDNSCSKLNLHIWKFSTFMPYPILYIYAGNFLFS